MSEKNAASLFRIYATSALKIEAAYSSEMLGCITVSQPKRPKSENSILIP
jgi:hypothetical protein